jgi:hypothetical protein
LPLADLADLVAAAFARASIFTLRSSSRTTLAGGDERLWKKALRLT